MDDKQKDELRKAFTAAINKENPNKLEEIKCRVNQLIKERKNKLLKKKTAGAG